MPKHFIARWMTPSQPEAKHADLWVFTEQPSARAKIQPAIELAVKDHLLDLSLIERMGGYEKSLNVIRNRLPTTKRIRSGDIGEILATEYVAYATDYVIPLKRLRYKDDRNTSMRGDDVVGVKLIKRIPSLLKVEAKSRARLSRTTVTEAAEALLKHSARPNPATLAFMSMMLRRENRDSEAETIEAIQSQELTDSQIEHLLFTLSGNDPTTVLTGQALSPRPKVRRHVVGFVIEDHQDFIASIFEALDG